MHLDILLASFMSVPCWLWWLLSGIIPFILGCLFCRAFSRKETEEKTTYNFKDDPEYLLMQDKLNAYEKSEAELKAKLEQAEAALKDCQDAKNVALGAAAAGAIGRDGVDRTGYAGLFASDNLQIVEGVGPKVESLLKEDGIKNWSDLAAKSPEELKAILVANKLQMMNPDSWPRQAQLADEGKWGELVEYQKFLDGGREDTGDFETPAKIDKLAEDAGFTFDDSDDD